MDGLRGFAALYVILYHFMPGFPRGFPGDLINTFFRMGWTGVDLFFVLSGFLITGVLYRSKGAPEYFRRFYLRRFLRIFPIYYLFVFVCVFVLPKLVPGFPEVEGAIWYWLYLSNFDSELGLPFHPYLCVAWSLSVEEQYYLVYPALVWTLSYRRWLGLLIGLVILSFVLRWIVYFGFGFQPINIYHFTFTHFDGIALGGLVRLLAFRFEENRRWLERFMAWSLPCALVMIGIAFFCYYDITARNLGHHFSFHPVMFLAGYLVNAVVYTQVLLRSIVHEGVLFRFFNARLFRHVGTYSYAMYLLQFPARDVADLMVARSGLGQAADLGQPMGAFVVCLLRLGMTYLFARVSWLLVEGPIARVKRRWDQEERKGGGPAIQA